MVPGSSNVVCCFGLPVSGQRRAVSAIEHTPSSLTAAKCFKSSYHCNHSEIQFLRHQLTAAIYELSSLNSDVSLEISDADFLDTHLSGFRPFFFAFKHQSSPLSDHQKAGLVLGLVLNRGCM